MSKVVRAMSRDRTRDGESFQRDSECLAEFATILSDSRQIPRGEENAIRQRRRRSRSLEDEPRTYAKKEPLVPPPYRRHPHRGLARYLEDVSPQSRQRISEVEEERETPFAARVEDARRSILSRRGMESLERKTTGLKKKTGRSLLRSSKRLRRSFSKDLSRVDEHPTPFQSVHFPSPSLISLTVLDMSVGRSRWYGWYAIRIPSCAFAGRT